MPTEPSTNTPVPVHNPDSENMDKLASKLKSDLKFVDIYETNSEDIIESFEDLPLDKTLLKGIASCNLEKPSAVQQRAVLPCLQNKNVIMQAQSGTGKTAAFSIAILSKIDLKVSKIQALILVPTRELAIQIKKEIMALGRYMVGLSCCTLIGGTRVRKDIFKLECGPQIVIGTPGRVRHVLFDSESSQNKNELVHWPVVPPVDTSSIKIIVVDEADEMLMMPKKSRSRRNYIFQRLPELKEQIHTIFSHVNANAGTTQKILASATMPPDVVKLMKAYMIDPVTILVKNEQLTLVGVKQFYVTVEGMTGKLETIADICEHLPKGAQVLIFCNTRDTVDWLTTNLILKGYAVASIHGQMRQVKRTGILQKFRSGTNQVLVTSDVCGRGIDIAQISLVINYDLPTSTVTYIHRAGRCGRYGRKGVAISLISSSEESVLKSIEEFYSTEINKMPTNVFEFF